MNICELGLGHCAVIANLHAESFTENWSTQAFADLVGLPATFGFLAFDCENDDPFGFILCQGDNIEAEIITIATRPAIRRQGVAGALLKAACAQTARMFLEVATDNLSAISFYEKHGFAKIGVRKNYYKRSDGALVNALVYEFTA
ncbi:ribosomal-protein-alanine acetyltransferase [Terasakiella brassicae]|uniref:Ribosomal-protein-alanine acetyltransferase n=1 Tax=Terasakiella brassicae TaxID=1634917 RepID=A0A917F7T5_9PROT|nr:GNAT family N-acetyltransferase [Terasakiella brassicae]GGF54069.1 ribosomal-protein-alanine acetyltransferase [Terasakiella brassicae]